MNPDFSTIAGVKKAFREGLSARYPIPEINGITDMALEEVLKMSRARIRLSSHEFLSSKKRDQLYEVFERLRSGEPIQYILGEVDFYGLRLKVDPSVLIPRPETEELIRWILTDVKKIDPVIIDLGTGSGCIAIALAKAMPQAKVYAVDNSVDALNLAQENANRNEVEVGFFQFDILERESIDFMSFDVMVSNPPYVGFQERYEMRENVLDFEPHAALFVPDDNPLIFYRRIVDLADGNLVKGGSLYFEINERYGSEIRSLLMDRRYSPVEIRKDLSGKERMIKAVKP